MAEYTKQVTILPSAAQAAGCSATCVGTGDAATPPRSIQYDATATAANRWRFGHWEYRTKHTDTAYPERSYVNPPYETDPTHSAFNPERLFEFFIYSGDQLVISDVIIDLAVVFVRVPTHLLVNSFNKSSPVQLVYDPATNLLVADY